MWTLSCLFPREDSKVEGVWGRLVFRKRKLLLDYEWVAYIFSRKKRREGRGMDVWEEPFRKSIRQNQERKIFVCFGFYWQTTISPKKRRETSKKERKKETRQWENFPAIPSIEFAFVSCAQSSISAAGSVSHVHGCWLVWSRRYTCALERLSAWNCVT